MPPSVEEEAWPQLAALFDKAGLEITLRALLRWIDMRWKGKRKPAWVADVFYLLKIASRQYERRNVKSND